MAPRLVSVLSVLVLLLGPSQSRTLFPFEEAQLTREHIDSLPEEDALLFAFEDQFDEIRAVNNTDKRCRYGPDDSKWPSTKALTKLRRQLSSENALIATTPPASVCYGTSKNDASCQALASKWSDPNTHIEDPTEVLSPLYQGLTCQPPQMYDSGSCTIGGSPSYVVKAATVSDIQTGVNFARNDFVRLVVKNTGHDVMGRSTGHGSFSIWTHGLKDVQYFDNYGGAGYTGPAIKFGAGVQTFELYKFANQKGVVAVAGEDQTVGVAGGYIQGGGYSPLSSLYGMAADHVVSFEVVTPLGEFVTADSSTNQDLYWALRGGGGGTFGVVTSVTIKVYKDMPVSAASWTLDSSKITKEKFWTATKTWFDRATDNVDAGCYARAKIEPSGSDFTFTMQSFFAPNKTATQLNSILAPYLSKLTSLNIPFSPKVTEYASFYSAWQAQFPLEPTPDVSTILASRLFPRSNFASETGRNTTFNVLRQTLEAGIPIKALNIGTRGSNPDNAVNPAMRNSVYHVTAYTSVDPKSPAAARTAFTNGTMAKWRGVTPSSGAYVNEADRMEPDWQKSFWGDKYERLLGIKREMDPRDTFWVNRGVGSEGWRVESERGDENGKLCRVG